MFLNLGLSSIFSFIDSGCASLGGKSQKWCYVCLIASHQMALISVCPIPDDGHLFKVVFAKLLRHKVTLYPFAICTYCVTGYFETM